MAEPDRLSIDVYQDGKVTCGLEIALRREDLDMTLDDYMTRVAKPAFAALFNRLRQKADG